MLRNYLLVAGRSLRKRVDPTVINVVGLAACLIISCQVLDDTAVIGRVVAKHGLAVTPGTGLLVPNRDDT